MLQRKRTDLDTKKLMMITLKDIQRNLAKCENGQPLDIPLIYLRAAIKFYNYNIYKYNYKYKKTEE